MIDVLVKRAGERHTAPKYHALTRPRAPRPRRRTARSRSPKWRGPVYIVHLSAAEPSSRSPRRATAAFRFAETCPQYLFLSYDNYEEPGFEGAKYV